MNYKFASAEWIAALRGAMGHRLAVGLAGSPDFRISFCEVIFNVPDGYGARNGELAWSGVSDGLNLDFQMRERDDVDSKLRADFAFVVKVAALDADDPAQAAQLEALGAGAVSSGKLVRIKAGDGPRDLTVHNVMARLTA